MLISLWNKLYANAFNKGNPAHVDRMSISERAIKISELQMRLDRIENDREKQTMFDSYPMGVQKMLDDLWAQLYSDNGRKNIPNTGGTWKGKAGESMWIPDDNVIPPNKGYSNMKHKTWGRIKHENNIKGIVFNDGRADFKPIALYSVALDWEKALGLDGLRYLVNTGDRQYLHEAAFSKLANQLGCSVQNIKEIKEHKNLVWHEETDCKTMQLVVREVHDNVKHFGGIAMLAIVLK